MLTSSVVVCSECEQRNDTSVLEEILYAPAVIYLALEYEKLIPIGNNVLNKKTNLDLVTQVFLKK
jgi:hypothetical protein